MSLQMYLMEKFKNWKPPSPVVVERSQGTITLSWERAGPFGFLAGDLLYTIQRKNRFPKWVLAYSGGRTTRCVDNLAPAHPHRFRLKIILKPNAVPLLADKAIAFYKHEKVIYEIFNKMGSNAETNNVVIIDESINQQTMDYLSNHEDNTRESITTRRNELDLLNNTNTICNDVIDNVSSVGTTVIYEEKQKWIESLWSEETWTNTDSDGTSAVCFSMTVRCGYLKQVQSMLEQKPDLINIINCNTGLTPLATAVRKGNLAMVKVLVSSGADINQCSCNGQSPLHLAVLSGNVPLVDFLLQNGANIHDRDWNHLRIEHYAVDSRSLDMVKFVLDLGDVSVQDNNGWTPLFRAVCQEANTEIIKELVKRGSDVSAKDRAGLLLCSVAKLLTNKHGHSRDSILRLVDENYPREKALANFTRLTKKVNNIHALIK